jgi:threonyl-tRNA synthetase
MEDKKQLEKMRHSCSHVLAAAVIKLYPKVKLAIGPAIEDGFYYDFDFGKKKISEKDLAKISQEMEKIIKAKLPFKKENVTIEKARNIFKNQPFKLELIAALVKGEKVKKVSLYKTGDLTDLCVGPHVTNTAKIGPFKLLSIAGAYWQGDEKKPMLTRIYGTCFSTKKALEEHLQKIEEAKERDHRKLGQQLGLFSITPEVGPGLVLWHPKGGLIRSIIEQHSLKRHLQSGYKIVYTPHIGRARLWQKSGHLKWYKENMFGPIEIEKEEYWVRPMNCPFHIMIYKSQVRSYRDLPLRLAEFGTVYRYEKSGVLHGLLRVRGFTQDDSQIFCRPDQVESELTEALEFSLSILQDFGLKLKELKFELSVRDPKKPGKYAGTQKDWQMAEKVLETILKKKKLPFKKMEGEAVFYGPKIDIKLEDALGRLWQLSTIQFDFNMPKGFKLRFMGQDGQQHEPYMVHRALLGSFERFFAACLEHFAGNFPVWLSPVQAVVIPITDKHVTYGQKIVDQLKEEEIRAEIDDRSETTSAKIRDAEMQKIPYILVVGDKERKAKNVNVRVRGEKSHGPMSLLEFTSLIKEDIAKKRQV